MVGVGGGEPVGRQFARRAVAAAAVHEPASEPAPESASEPESESEQLRRSVLLIWKVMLVLAIAYCTRRACLKRCGSRKGTPAEASKRLAL